MRETILRRLRQFDLVVVAAIFLVMPSLLRLQRTTDFIIFCIFVLAFDLLYGHMGRLSFGHMLYLGTGAYAAATCAVYLTPNPFVALAAALLAGAAVGLLLGPLVVRTTGACFALINLAFNQVGYFLALIAFARGGSAPSSRSRNSACMARPWNGSSSPAAWASRAMTAARRSVMALSGH